MSIKYTIVDSPLGRLLVGATEKGVSAVFIDDSDHNLTETLYDDYPAGDIQPDDGSLTEWASSIVRHLEGQQPHLDLPLDVQATAFQRRVWQELQAIPYGETRSYGEIAAAIGSPKAVRAVGSACANNRAALVIPCHRAVRSDGTMGGYRWGMERKEAILAREKQRKA